MATGTDRRTTLSPELLAVLHEHLPIGQAIRSLTRQQPNWIAEVTPQGVRIETLRSREAGSGPQLVPAWMIQVAWERLVARGRLTNAELLATDDLNVKRSSAVLAMLAALPYVDVNVVSPRGDIALVHHGPQRDAPGLTAELTEADVNAAIARRDEMGDDAFIRWVGEQPTTYTIVDGVKEYDAVPVLRAARLMRGFPVNGTFHEDSASVAEPLRRLGFFVESPTDQDNPMSKAEERLKRWLDKLPATTDGWTKRTYRREQSVLRLSLGLGSARTGTTGTCGLCARDLPSDMLIAAHVKPRHACSHDERLDIPWIAMPACLLGCDALYERGYLSVADDGQLLLSDRDIDLKLWDGRTAAAHNADRREYFTWHRQHVFA